MKLCYILYMAWWFLHSVQSASLEDNLEWLKNPVNDDLALETPETPELEDADIEMLPLEESDLEEAIREEEYLEELEMDYLFRNMSHNKFLDREENVPYPSGKRLNLAIGDHHYCGPYTMHYTKAQHCNEVGLHYGRDTKHGITVAECEAKCDDHFSCNAINWSHLEGKGCVLRDCGPEAIPKPFPMPVGWNNDFLSFSRYKPEETPQCKKNGGSYDTPNTYCGPYTHTYTDQQCPVAGLYPDIPLLECEHKCDAQRGCTAFNYSRVKGLGCVLRRCRGFFLFQPRPNGFNADFVSYSKDPLAGSHCILDNREIH